MTLMRSVMKRQEDFHVNVKLALLAMEHTVLVGHRNETTLQSSAESISLEILEKSPQIVFQAAVCPNLALFSFDTGRWMITKTRTSTLH